ncbi:MAG: hypothetical protein QXI36_02120 [Candidatus Bathyarchaeia archaeon]
MSHLYNMLPFLEGWRGHYFTKTETVTKGEYKLVYSEMSIGWLIFFLFTTTDAFGSTKFTYLGETNIQIPNALYLTGAVMPPPGGTYLLEYIRPSTLSTAGIYSMANFVMAEPMPVKGLVRIELGLEQESTQTTATSTVIFMYIEITDIKAFTRSYRKFKYGWLGSVLNAIARLPGFAGLALSPELKGVMD